MKAGVFLALRIIVLTILLFVCYAIAAGIAGVSGGPQTEGQAGGAARGNVRFTFDPADGERRLDDLVVLADALRREVF